MAKGKESAKTVTATAVQAYRLLVPQLDALLDEIRELSKKKPDGAINKFKLGFVNEKLQLGNELLGADLLPLRGFTQFDVNDLPSNSDVVLILSQYMGALNVWEKERTYTDAVFDAYWRTEPPLPK